ncbi:hypothetical protein BDW59DRAFT_70320 [Aspergillus cavernicola]|uniref:Uncharacterized protein n=1 Tax=Aspergillus cavernicola TaxID=176166 RepID=A0ABR4IDL9_9EURO
MSCRESRTCLVKWFQVHIFFGPRAGWTAFGMPPVMTIDWISWESIEVWIGILLGVSTPTLSCALRT